MQKLKITLSYILGGVALLGAVALAGSLTPPDGSSTDTPTMFTTSDIYNRLDDINHTPQNKNTSTTSSPDISMRSLSEIWDNFPTILSNTIATGTTIMGITGTLYGDTDPSKVLDTAIYPGTATVAPYSLVLQTEQDFVLNWDDAISYAQHLEIDGITVSETPQNIWRLATISELMKFYGERYLEGNPNNITGFLSGNVYWASTLAGGISPYYIGYDEGSISFFYADKINLFNVRCVR
jgi:hypothetical protein